MNWNDWIAANEVSIRTGFFLGVFTLMAVWELLAPGRKAMLGRQQRWPANIGLVILNSIVLRLLFPAAAVGVAVYATQQGWGLMHLLSVPLLPAVVISVVLLDLIIYLQHVMVHKVPVLWRLHRVHHADLDYDVTTGARFHTLEIVLSMLIKFAAILLFGVPVVAVVIFEVVLNATAMFNHSNIRLPEPIDRVLRYLLVTPDMHRVHHSIEYDETNSNFGFNLPLWDRLFGTYRAQPRAGHTDMIIGLSNFRDPHQVNHLTGMLVMPFVAQVRDDSNNLHSPRT
jgi:sterol desaturase/sphingolipid hydroxylase (fatty acid hydroxylase superfamily)